MEMEKGQFYRVFLGSFELPTDNERLKKYEIEVTMLKGYQSPKAAYYCPYILCFEKQDNHVVLVVYSDEQKNDIVEVIRYENWGRYRLGAEKDTIDYDKVTDFYDDFVPCQMTWDEIFDVENLPDDWCKVVADEGTEIVSCHTQSIDFDETDKFIYMEQLTECAQTLLFNTSAIVLKQLLKALIDIINPEIFSYTEEISKVVRFIHEDGFDITGYGLYEVPDEGVFVFLNNSTGKFFDIYVIYGNNGEEKITAGYLGDDGCTHEAESIKDAVYSTDK